MKIKITGMNELRVGLDKKMDLKAVRTVVQKNGADLQRNAQEKADFKKGYQTGTTKRSIGIAITNGGMTAEVGPTTEYSPYLEYGTRYMDAQPFVGPAFNEQKNKFVNDLKKLVK